MPIRLVATDLDGTLLGSEGRISERTRAALRAATAAGHLVLPVTGRPPQATYQLARDAGLGPLGVCSNGAVIVDLEAERVVELVPLARDIASRLVALLHLVDGLLLAVDDLQCFSHEPGFLDSSEDWDQPVAVVDDVAPVISDGCVKLIARVPGWSATRLIAHLTDVLGDEEAQVTSSGLDWVDIGAAGVTKAYALQRVCDRLGVAVTDVVAIGDNHNDLSVLAWAGTAMAPANAVPEVLALVDRVLPANTDDGVAAFLEELARGD